MEKAAFLASVPPFLLKTPDNPGGVDGSVFDGIKKAIAADRLAYLSFFLANFCNVDVLGPRGEKRVSDQVVQYSWNVAAGASATGTLDCAPAWLTDFRNDLPRIDVPTLVMRGDADWILPLAATGIPLSKGITGARLVVEGRPHGLIWTHAAQGNAELVDFLR